MPGVLPVVQHVRHIEGPPWLGSYDVVLRISHIKEHPGWVLLCPSVHQVFDGPASTVQLLMLACGEREAMVMAPPPPAVSPCFHGFLAFLHRHFPPQSPSSHLPPTRYPHLSLRGQQQPSPWYCSTIPKLQLPASAPFRGRVFLSRVSMAAARTV